MDATAGEDQLPLIWRPADSTIYLLVRLEREWDALEGARHNLQNKQATTSEERDPFPGRSDRERSRLSVFLNIDRNSARCGPVQGLHNDRT
ncbi:MAG TPA: hypothetical protein VM093_06760 [Aeromicrobium sp.]|nr:hypothetical protein [Aeromicrobium sp.]